MKYRLVLVLAVLAPSVPLACSTPKEPSPTYLSRDVLMDPTSCQKCHADHFREWSGSMHAYAADDPVFLAMNRRGQRETKGALGKFCVNCHAPMAVREGATTDGLNLATVPQKLKGVTCFFCHTADRVEGVHNNPLHLSDDPVMLGEFGDPVPNSAHRAAYSPLHDRDQADSAKLCGACHDIVTDHGAAIERTFSEWQGSVFSHAGGATCGQCHMDQSANLQPIAQAPGVFSRRFHGHGFPAVDIALTPFPEADAQRKRVQSFLDSTLQTALCVSPSGNIRVLVDNVAAGHGFPSGSAQDRRLWAEVVAYKGTDVIYKSGVATEGTPIVQSADPDLWLLRDCMFDQGGKEVHMFWEAASYETNQLPAQLTFDPRDPRFYQTHITQTFPRGGAFLPSAPDRVTMRIRLQPMGDDVLDDLIATGDLDKSVKAAMPTFDLGVVPMLEWTPATATETYFEDKQMVKCVTKTNFNVAADKVPAPNRARCRP